VSLIREQQMSTRFRTTRIRAEPWKQVSRMSVAPTTDAADLCDDSNGPNIYRRFAPISLLTSENRLLFPSLRLYMFGWDTCSSRATISPSRTAPLILS